MPDTGVDGGWSEWGEWTECSAECGPGTKSRARTCTSPEPSGTGLTCSGENSDSESCQDSACEGKPKFSFSLYLILFYKHYETIFSNKLNLWFYNKVTCNIL